MKSQQRATRATHFSSPLRSPPRPAARTGHLVVSGMMMALSSIVSVTRESDSMNDGAACSARVRVSIWLVLSCLSHVGPMRAPNRQCVVPRAGRINSRPAALDSEDTRATRIARLLPNSFAYSAPRVCVRHVWGRLVRLAPSGKKDPRRLSPVCQHRRVDQGLSLLCPVALA